MNRWPDWWEQAGRDLDHARHALEHGYFEWAAFASQQAAEKALKAVIMSHGGEPWGHSVTALAEALPGDLGSQEELIEAASRLDKHYIPARYPNTGSRPVTRASSTPEEKPRGPLPMRNKSSKPAGAIYLDRDERIDRLRQAAQRGLERIPSIKRVILFGSLADGTPTPSSDADILIEVASSPHAEPRDRIPEMLRAFSPLPCPIDLFVLTTREVEMHSRQKSPLLREIFAHGVDLLGDATKGS